MTNSTAMRDLSAQEIEAVSGGLGQAILGAIVGLIAQDIKDNGVTAGYPKLPSKIVKGAVQAAINAGRPK